MSTFAPSGALQEYLYGSVDPAGRGLPASIAIYSGAALISAATTDGKGAWSVPVTWSGPASIRATIGGESVGLAESEWTGAVRVVFPPVQSDAPVAPASVLVGVRGTGGRSLLLDLAAWDLTMDDAGNIAAAQAPYGIAQDVACAVRLFAGECWYDTDRGIPYFEDVLGKAPPLALITRYIEGAALTVPGVVQAQCAIDAGGSREVVGTISVIDEAGAANNVRF